MLRRGVLLRSLIVKKACHVLFMHETPHGDERIALYERDTLEGLSHA